MTDEPTGTKVKDESQDQKYFTITPRLVWALARNPYDYTLWATIKGIAGEAGECFLSTEDLATLSMMSAGQVSDSRKYWMEVKLLHGDFRRDPGYPQPVWHLSIPNIWAANIEWATKYASLKERVQYKREQLEDIRAQRETARKASQEAKKSLQVVKPSGGEEGVTSGEEGVTPTETKNIHKENQKDISGGEETPPPPPAEWGVGWQLGAGVKKVELPTEEQLAEARLKDAVGMFAPNYQHFVRAFIEATGIFPIKKDVSGWTEAFKSQVARTGLTADNVTEACKQMFAEKLTVKDPFSVMNKIANIRAKKHTSTTIAPLNTPFANAVDNYVPKPRPARTQATR